VQVSFDHRHVEVGPPGEQLRGPDILAGIVHVVRELWPVPDRLAEHGGDNPVGGALDQLAGKAAADAVAHKEELADAEVVHQPELVVGEGAPRVAGRDRAARLTAVGVAWSIVITRKSFFNAPGVEHRGRPIADPGVQAPPGVTNSGKPLPTSS